MSLRPAPRPPVRTALQRRLAIMVANWRAGPLWWTVPFFVLVILCATMIVVVFFAKTQGPPK